MNSATRNKLIEFLKQVQNLAIGVRYEAGNMAVKEQATILISVTEELKAALKSDETII